MVRRTPPAGGFAGLVAGVGGALGLDHDDAGRAFPGSHAADDAEAYGRLSGREPVPPRAIWLRTRPSLPLTLWLALGLWAGIAAAYPPLRARDESTCLAVIVACVILAVTLLALLRAGWGGALPVFALGFAVGMICAGTTAMQMHQTQRQIVGRSGAAVVELVQDGRRGSFGTTVMGRVRLENGAAARVRVNLADDVDLMGTERIRVQVTWREPSSSSAESCWTNGITATANASSFEPVPSQGAAAAVCGLRRHAVDALEQLTSESEEGTQFLEAVLLGWRGDMFDSAWYAAAKADGLAHMVAVSGAHLAIVCGLTLALMGRLGVPRRIQWAVQLSLIAAYLALTGVAVSAVRAAFMTVIGLSAFLAGRRPYSLGALSIAIAVMLALDPRCAFSVSFALSAGSTLGIVLFARYGERFIAGLGGRRRAGALASALALTLAAQLITDPLSASWFGQLSLIAPLANALMGPCFTVVCGLGLPLVLLVCAWDAALPVLGLLARGCGLLCQALQLMARVPGASVPVCLDGRLAVVLAVALPAVLWMAWPRPRIGFAVRMAAVAGALGAVLALGPLASGDQIVMLDVGQGDAFLLRSEGKTMLIDTGNHDRELLQGLARHQVYRLDAVAITHADDDHCGSLSALKGVVPIGQVIVAADMTASTAGKAQALVRTAADVCGSGDEVVGVPAGGQLTFGNYTCTVLGPDHFTDDGGNADSLTMLVEADETGDGQAEWRGLFCGDAEKEQLAAYEQAGLVGDVDIYKVGHHGSRVAVDQQTAAVLHPEICLVSVGANNRYGHPVPSTLETLEQAGGRVWRTDEQGDVVCELDATGIRVRTQR